MNVLSQLRERFHSALASLAPDAGRLADLVLPSQDARFGDYQANCAMPLAKQLGRPPRDVARQIVDNLHVSDMCLPPDVAGPGFINLRLRDAWLADLLELALGDEDRLGVARVQRPRTFVLDYSGPNVAKPMHVGHIRSTLIGDSLNRLLRFLGHRTVSDNHIGDWGTQFGMILHGYKNFRDPAAYASDPVEELSRIYRLVRKLMDYQDARQRIASLERHAGQAQEQLQQARARRLPENKSERRKVARDVRAAEQRCEQLETEAAGLRQVITEVEGQPKLARLAAEHAAIGATVLEETAKLHAGDKENLALWREFLPPCLKDIEAIYQRLDIAFDYTLGESFYHDRLPRVVDELRQTGLATESDGAWCMFLEGFDTPMLIRKQDGAFLYATTDLATLQYRMETFHPDAILYVVDHRQSLHFEQLFAAARRWGFTAVELQHVRFGTVLGEAGRPFKTRAGDTVGLAGLLDEAVRRAEEIVTQNDDAKTEPELSAKQRRAVAEQVGLGALKYADLSQNRESDYTFSYDKMLAMRGNTATYMQYSYARVRSIFEKAGVPAESVRAMEAGFVLKEPAERALALALVRLSEAVQRSAEDYRMNHLTSYLFDVASRFAEFFEQCPVLRAGEDSVRTSRLKLCDVTARTIKLGLALLGIGVVEKM